MEPFEKRANMTTGGIARGGKLVFDGEALRFGNHGLDRALTGDADWSVPLAAVETADVKPGSLSPKGLFSGGIRAAADRVGRRGAPVRRDRGEAARGGHHGRGRGGSLASGPCASPWAPTTPASP